MSCSPGRTTATRDGTRRPAEQRNAALYAVRDGMGQGRKIAESRLAPTIRCDSFHASRTFSSKSQPCPAAPRDFVIPAFLNSHDDWLSTRPLNRPLDGRFEARRDTRDRALLRCSTAPSTPNQYKNSTVYIVIALVPPMCISCDLIPTC